MKRIFFQSRIYDYTSKAEAVKHIKQMKSNGWDAIRQSDGKFVYMNNQDKFAYSVEFVKKNSNNTTDLKE